MGSMDRHKGAIGGKHLMEIADSDLDPVARVVRRNRFAHIPRNNICELERVSAVMPA